MGVHRTQSSILQIELKTIEILLLLLGCLHETSLIIQFASIELSGVSFQIVSFISKRMKRVAQICNLIYLYTELYQRKIFD